LRLKKEFEKEFNERKRIDLDGEYRARQEQDAIAKN
jgi:hypothetical protein